MGVARGLAQFAAGFGKGYLDGLNLKRQQKMEDEKHAAEMQRLALENQKLQDFQNARDEIKALASTSDKPAKAFVVQSPNGQMVYTDEKMAQAHAANDPSAQVVPSFVVNGQTFADQHDAEQAAKRASTPAAMLAREIGIYKKYGLTDQANATLGLYQKELDTNRKALQQAFLDARATGDIKGALSIYNDNLLNGAKADVQQGPNGEIIVTRMRGDQAIGKPEVFKDANDFWQRTTELVAAAPDTMLQSLHFDKEFGLKQGQLANDTKRTTAQVGHLAAQTADIPLAAADRHTQVTNNTALTGAQVGHLAAQTADIPLAAADRSTQVQTGAFNAQTQRLGLTKPTVSAVPDAKGGLNFVAPAVTLDAQGNYTLGAPQVQAAPGLQYPAGYVAQQRNSLEGLGLGGPSTPQLDPKALQQVMTQMQQEAERRKASRGQNSGPAAPAAKYDRVAPEMPPAAPAGSGLGLGDAVRGAMNSFLTPEQGSLPMAPLGPRSSGGRVTPVRSSHVADIHVLHDLVMQQESGGQRYGSDGRLLQSPDGAKGEMQVMDATNRNPGYGVMPARDNSPEERARVGRDYLAAMVRKFGNVPMGLAAYNAGPGAVQRALKKSKGGDWLPLLPAETESYVANIMGRYRAAR